MGDLLPQPEILFASYSSFGPATNDTWIFFFLNKKKKGQTNQTIKTVLRLSLNKA